MKNKFFLLAITFCLPIHSQGVSKSFIPMAEIPAGSFYMGSDGLGEDFDEAPIHQVIISRPFRMGITEITNAQYESFRPEHRALRGKNGVSLEDDEAVVNVSYSDAVAFCEWLSRKEGKNYRLPTEAEWEYAARGGSNTAYPWGNAIGKGKANCDNSSCGDTFDFTAPVGSFAANGYGLHDMNGNVWEWCQDWYGDYSSSPASNPKGSASGTYRVLRGGSWFFFGRHCRSAVRNASDPARRDGNFGFRLALGLELPSLRSGADQQSVGTHEPPKKPQGVTDTLKSWFKK